LQLLREAVDTTLNSTVSPHSNINGRSENSKTELLKLDVLPFRLSIPDAPHSSNPIPGMCTASMASLKSPVVAEYPQCEAIMNKILCFDWLMQLGLVAQLQLQYLYLFPAW